MRYFTDYPENLVDLNIITQALSTLVSHSCETGIYDLDRHCLTKSLQIPPLIGECQSSYSAIHSAMHLSTNLHSWFYWNITSCWFLMQTVLCSGHILGPAIILRLWRHCGKGHLWTGTVITTWQVMTLSHGKYVNSTFWVWQQAVFVFQKNSTWFSPLRQWGDSRFAFNSIDQWYSRS